MWVKEKNLWRYGMVEIAFGVAASISITFRMNLNQSVLAQWVALVGCAYVVARGLNNLGEARRKDEVSRQGSQGTVSTTA
jgi:hypothetical protein